MLDFESTNLNPNNRERPRGPKDHGNRHRPGHRHVRTPGVYQQSRSNHRRKVARSLPGHRWRYSVRHARSSRQGAQLDCRAARYRRQPLISLWVGESQSCFVMLRHRHLQHGIERRLSPSGWQHRQPCPGSCCLSCLAIDRWPVWLHRGHQQARVQTRTKKWHHFLSCEECRSTYT